MRAHRTAGALRVGVAAGGGPARAHVQAARAQRVAAARRAPPRGPGMRAAALAGRQQLPGPVHPSVPGAAAPPARTGARGRLRLQAAAGHSVAGAHAHAGARPRRRRGARLRQHPLGAAAHPAPVPGGRRQVRVAAAGSRALRRRDGRRQDIAARAGPLWLTLTEFVALIVAASGWNHDAAGHRARRGAGRLPSADRGAGVSAPRMGGGAGEMAAALAPARHPGHLHAEGRAAHRRAPPAGARVAGPSGGATPLRLASLGVPCKGDVLVAGCGGDAP
eukprot:scaffold2608_cov362-Prasinococcus_capsulatus_cf.AAC.9